MPRHLPEGFPQTRYPLSEYADYHGLTLEQLTRVIRVLNIRRIARDGLSVAQERCLDQWLYARNSGRHAPKHSEPSPP